MYVLWSFQQPKKESLLKTFSRESKAFGSSLVCEIGSGFSTLMYYYFIKPRCILFPSLNTLNLCKAVSETGSENCVVDQECCVFLRGSRSTLLVCVLQSSFDCIVNSQWLVEVWM